ncbi:MAG: nucleotidyltransferase family protein [Bacteroidales bacterium]|nr:nucleotidyltransferase family protein [Bacteroidales bacterium]
MKCVVLAAGYATRLYPLTENFPKPLLEVAGRPILDHLLDDIESSGLVDGYVVVSNHKFAGHFQEWASGHRLSGKITVLDDGTTSNETRLGAVKDIVFAVEKLRLEGDLLVIAGDNLLSFSLSRFIEAALSRKASCVMRYYEPDLAKLCKAGVAEVAEDGLILSMEEKPSRPRSNWCLPQFYYYTASDAALIARAVEDGCGTDAPGSLVAWMASHSKVYAWEMPGPRYDIGDLESYRRVQEIFETQRAAPNGRQPSARMGKQIPD